jgi:hypothetical protein
VAQCCAVQGQWSDIWGVPLPAGAACGGGGVSCSAAVLVCRGGRGGCAVRICVLSHALLSATFAAPCTTRTASSTSVPFSQWIAYTPCPSPEAMSVARHLQRARVSKAEHADYSNSDRDNKHCAKERCGPVGCMQCISVQVLWSIMPRAPLWHGKESRCRRRKDCRERLRELASHIKINAEHLLLQSRGSFAMLGWHADLRCTKFTSFERNARQVNAACMFLK